VSAKHVEERKVKVKLNISNVTDWTIWSRRFSTFFSFLLWRKFFLLVLHTLIILMLENDLVNHYIALCYFLQAFCFEISYLVDPA